MMTIKLTMTMFLTSVSNLSVIVQYFQRKWMNMSFQDFLINIHKGLDSNKLDVYCAEMCRRTCWPKTHVCLYGSGQNNTFPCISTLRTLCNWSGQLSEEWTSRDLLAVIRRCLVQIPCGVGQSGPKWEPLSDLSSTDAPENDGCGGKLSLWINAPSCK